MQELQNLFPFAAQMYFRRISDSKSAEADFDENDFRWWCVRSYAGPLFWIRLSLFRISYIELGCVVLA